MKHLKTASIVAMALVASSGFPATAADISPPVEAYDWSGFYFGMHVGAGWGDKDNGRSTSVTGGVGGVVAAVVVVLVIAPQSNFAQGATGAMVPKQGAIPRGAPLALQVLVAMVGRQVAVATEPMVLEAHLVVTVAGEAVAVTAAA